MKITLLDLFSGMGGFHLGLERSGFEVTSYFSEIDKYAIEVYQNNFKQSTYVGSVTDVYGRDLPKIDCITFGSPCQDFSLAGKRKGMDGARSSLISEAIRLIDECRPSFFIWENVKGTFSSNNGADFTAIMQSFANIGGYRLEWQLLNTKWFLPQNRERIYLVGYAPNGSGRQIFPIGESDGKSNRVEAKREESACITTSYHKGVNWDNQLVKVVTNNSKGYDIAKEGDTINLQNINSKTRRGRVGKGVAQTLDGKCEQAVVAGTWRTHKDGQGFREIKDGDCPTIPARAREDGSGQPVIAYNVPEMVSVRKYEVDIESLKKLLKKSKNKTNKEISEHLNVPKTQVDHWFRSDKSFSIPPKEVWMQLKSLLNIETTEFDQSIMTFEIKESTYEQTNRVYDAKGIAPTITSTSGDVRITKLFNGSRIRRLTPIECERLQGFPDNWTQYGSEGLISDTQRYKMCGNAVTVDVVKAVTQNIKNIL